MQQVDAETIARVVPGSELMERAGRGVAKLIAGRVERGKAVIFVGPGNNGGDGLVVARLLAAAGWECSIHLLKTSDLTPDTAKNYQRIDKKVIREFDSSRPDWLKPTGGYRILVQYARRDRHPGYPDTPTARELAPTPEGRALIEFTETGLLTMARPYAAPPDVPADRARALRDAFDAVHRDKEFLAENPVTFFPSYEGLARAGATTR